MKYLCMVAVFASFAFGEINNSSVIWQVQGVDADGIYNNGSSLIFSLPKNKSAEPGSEISYRFELDDEKIEDVRFIVNDSFLGSACGYIVYGIKVNGEVIRQIDVCDAYADQYEYVLPQSTGVVRSIEVYAKIIKRISNFAVSISWDGIYLKTDKSELKLITSDYTNYSITGTLPKDLPLISKPVMNEQWLKDAVIFQPWGIYEYEIFYKDNPSLEDICRDFGINAIAFQPWPDFMRYGYEGVTEDDFIKLLDRCRKLGLKIILYSSIMHQGHGPQWQDGTLEKEHPEWSQRDKNGNPITIYGHEWLCPTTGALDFTLEYTKSLIDKYGGDAVMLDNNEFLSTDSTETGVTCYCQSCRKAFREYVVERFAGEYDKHLNIPSDKIDIPSGRSDLYNLWIHWRNRTWAQGVAKFREQINIPVFANTQYHYKNYWLGTDLQYDCEDAVFSESGSMVGSADLGAKMLLGNSISQNKPLINYMGTFVKGVKPVVLREPHQAATAVAVTIAYNAKPWLLWHGMTDKQSNQQSYEIIQKIMKFRSANAELYKDLIPVGETAVLFSPQSRNYCGKPLIPSVVYDMQLSGVAVQGLWQNYLKEQIEKYSVIVAQNVCSIDESNVNLIKQWIHNGGIFIMTSDFASFDEIGRSRKDALFDKFSSQKGRLITVDSGDEIRPFIEKCSSNEMLTGEPSLEFRPYYNDKGMFLHIVNHSGTPVKSGHKIVLPRKVKKDYQNCIFYSPQSEAVNLDYDKVTGVISAVPQIEVYAVIKLY